LPAILRPDRHPGAGMTVRGGDGSAGLADRAETDRRAGSLRIRSDIAPKTPNLLTSSSCCRMRLPPRICPLC
jgi:hypothetical protein